MVVAAAGITAAGAIGGSLISKSGAKSAAGQASQADLYAAQLAQQRYETTRQDLLPYNVGGQMALSGLPAIMGTNANDLRDQFNYMQYANETAKSHIPHAMTEDELVKTPGYQFNLNQGLKAAQSGAAMKGLGFSGAAMQGAANYATGLADNTYQNQFAQQQQLYNDYNNQFGNAGTLFNTRNAFGNTLYNQNLAIANLGESAAAQTGNNGAQLANIQATALQGAGNSLAAGTLGSSNALAGGINGVSNALGKYLYSQGNNNPSDASGYSGGYSGGYDGSAASNYGTQSQGANELQQMGFYTPLGD